MPLATGRSVMTVPCVSRLPDVPCVTSFCIAEAEDSVQIGRWKEIVALSSPSTLAFELKPDPRFQMATQRSLGTRLPRSRRTSPCRMVASPCELLLPVAPSQQRRRGPEADSRVAGADPNIRSLPGLTISFSDEIPVFSGNEISDRNFGKFRWIFDEIC